MLTRHWVQEGAYFDLSPADRARLASAVRAAEQLVRPRGKYGLVERGEQVAVWGLIGTVALAHDVELVIAPKTAPTGDWTQAVLHLLEADDRLAVAGQRSSDDAHRRDLRSVYAELLAGRLLRALRRDGPIMLFEEVRETKPVLRGKLNSTAYVRWAVWRPHLFPQRRTMLSADNDFSRALAAACLLLAPFASRTTGALLRRLAREVRPGHAAHAPVRDAVLTRLVPNQYAVYGPAWSIAVAALRQRALLAPTGRAAGVSLLVEAWPLHERLVTRGLQKLASDSGGAWLSVGKQRTALLTNPSDPRWAVRGVEPDGRLIDAHSGDVVAVYDAKYKRQRMTEWPSREDLYQVVASALACEAPLGVLIYPEAFAPIWWDVLSSGGHPAHVVAIGVDLFSYRRSAGDARVAADLRPLLVGRPGLALHP